MRGAIFDVDGTLLDSMQVWWDVVVDFFKEHGVELPYEEAKEYKEMTMKESIPTIKNRLNLDLSFEELSNTFMHMGLKQYETTVPLKKGADKYLKKLHNNGIKIAIATSGYEERLCILVRGRSEQIKSRCLFACRKTYRNTSGRMYSI